MISIAGNNIFREDIRHTLLRNPESRSQYILMDRIQPEISKNLMVRHELPGTDYRDVIPELGILGIIIRYAIRNGKKMDMNDLTAYPVRNSFFFRLSVVVNLVTVKLMVNKGILFLGPNARSSSKE